MNTKKQENDVEYTKPRIIRRHEKLDLPLTGFVTRAVSRGEEITLEKRTQPEGETKK